MAGTVGTFFAVLADVLVNGGEIIAIVGLVLVDQLPVLYTALAAFTAAAPGVGWLPQGALSTLFTAVALAVGVITLVRFAQSTRDRFTEKTE